MAKANAIYDSPNYLEEDNASSAASKNSLTTRTMEISMDGPHVKPLTIHSTIKAQAVTSC